MHVPQVHPQKYYQDFKEMEFFFQMIANKNHSVENGAFSCRNVVLLPQT